jgi:myo-inositol-1(or 4)-monophosphatase
LLGSVSNLAWPWDIAAAGLIVREAGGLVSDLDGKPRRLDEAGPYIVAANKTIHAELLKATNASRL